MIQLTLVLSIHMYFLLLAEYLAQVVGQLVSFSRTSLVVHFRMLSLGWVLTCIDLRDAEG